MVKKPQLDLKIVGKCAIQEISALYVTCPDSLCGEDQVEHVVSSGRLVNVLSKAGELTGVQEGCGSSASSDEGGKRTS